MDKETFFQLAERPFMERAGGYVANVIILATAIRDELQFKDQVSLMFLTKGKAYVRQNDKTVMSIKVPNGIALDISNCKTVDSLYTIYSTIMLSHKITTAYEMNKLKQ